MTHVRKWNMQLDKIAKIESKFRGMNQIKYRAVLQYRPAGLRGQ